MTQRTEPTVPAIADVVAPARPPAPDWASVGAIVEFGIGAEDVADYEAF